MTLVLSVQTKDSIWLVADRRLSWKNGPPDDNAIKIATFEGTDGQAIIGYAGLGATKIGNQPSQWIANVLRGPRYDVLTALEILCGAMLREFPPHLLGFSSIYERQHSFVAPAFVNGKHELYTIDFVAETDGTWKFRNARWIMGGDIEPLQIAVPIGLSGSGRQALVRAIQGGATWERELYSAVKAFNRKRISSISVGSYLSNLCLFAHRNTIDRTVGPSCIVVWRLRDGGGGQHFYNIGVRCEDAVLPTVAGGLDMSSLLEETEDLIISRLVEGLKNHLDGKEPQPESDAYRNEMQQRLARVKTKPDEKLK